MQWEMKWGPLPVWAWGTIAALTLAAVIGARKSKASSGTDAPAPVRTVGVTQIQPVLITPQGKPSQPVSDMNTAANYYGGI
jgi:hypothetical protein